MALLRYCTYGRARDFMERMIAAPAGQSAAATKQANDWLVEAGIEERRELAQDQLVDHLKAAAGVDVDSFLSKGS